MSSGTATWASRVASTTLETFSCTALPAVEKESMATFGGLPARGSKERAELTAISARLAASGSTTRPQSAKTKMPFLAWCGAHSIIRKKLDTRPVPGARPIVCSAARTVSAVVATAPPTVPSASPSRTIIAAKTSGERSAIVAGSSSTPLPARRT